jgi:hypothetical protein
MAEQRDANPYFQEKKFIDLARGREGTFVTKKKVDVPQHKEIPYGYRIVWIPDSDALTSIGSILKMITGSGIERITDDVYPKSAVKERSNPSTAEGAHDQEVVALETVEHGAPWLESLKADIETGFTDMEAKLQEQESKQLAEVAKNLENRGENRVTASDKAIKRRNRGRGNRKNSDRKNKNRGNRKNRDSDGDNR